MKGFTINRRDFFKYCAGLAVVLGYSTSYGHKIAKAVEKAIQKPPLLWIEGQTCGGCFRSIINSTSPSFGEFLLDMLSIRFSDNLSWGLQQHFQKNIKDTISDGKYILLISGAIPTGNNGAFCTTNYLDKQMQIVDLIKDFSSSASAIIASGVCATDGGIVGSIDQFKVVPTQKLLSGKKVINIPGCPPHPDWIMATAVSLLLFGKLPELDNYGRPKEFFSRLVHEDCSRRGSFEAGIFAESFTDAQEDKCLFKLGCKGPVTFADCPKRRWNSRQSWCIEANSICVGCANKDFIDGIEPLFSPLSGQKLPYTGTLNAINIGKAVAIGTGLGIGLNEATKRLKRKKPVKHDSRETDQ